MEEKQCMLSLQDRRDLHLTGVTEVDSSEDTRVALKTILGDMVVEGKELRILNLDLNQGEAAVGGKIDALIYVEKQDSDKNRTKRRRGKLFS